MQFLDSTQTSGGSCVTGRLLSVLMAVTGGLKLPISLSDEGVLNLVVGGKLQVSVAQIDFNAQLAV